MPFITKEEALKNEFCHSQKEFYFKEIMNIYAEANNVRDRIDLLKLLMSLDLDPTFIDSEYNRNFPI